MINDSNCIVQLRSIKTASCQSEINRVDGMHQACTTIHRWLSREDHEPRQSNNVFVVRRMIKKATGYER